MSIELVTLSNHLTFSYPLLLLPSIFPSIRVFSRLFAIVAKFLELQHQFFQWIFRVDFPLGLTGLISLLSKGLSRVFSSTTVWKHQLFGAQPSLWYNSHNCTWLPKHSFDYMDLCWPSGVSAFNTLSRFVIAFLPRNKHLVISWLQSQCTVILEPKKIKSVTVSTFSLSICHEVMGLDAMNLVFWSWDSSQLFHSPPSPSSRGSSVPLHFLYLLLISVCWYFSWRSWFQFVIHPALPSFYMRYSTQKLNKQDGNIQPSHSHFPILNQIDVQF